VIVAIDLLLHKPQVRSSTYQVEDIILWWTIMRDVKSSDGCTKVYRHLLFNRLPYREHGIEQNVLKLGVLLVLFDVCRHL
jgi:hypothetical protein